MRARERGNKIHDYLDTSGKPRREIPLGSEYVTAVQKWAELTADARTIQTVHIKWRVHRARDLAQPKNLERKAAGQKPLKVPSNIGQVRANREKSLLSHVFNFARKKGYAKAANPCTGITGFKEIARDVVVGDELLRKVLEAGDQALRFAIRLAHLTGQRPADVIRMSENHITGDILNVCQGKTATKLRIEISEELKALIEEFRQFKQEHLIQSANLLVSENGTPLTHNLLRNRFDAAREAAKINKADFQFRDLRATAATAVDESAGTRSAQALLGHTTEAMTSTYIRHKVGRKVAPVK